MKSKKSKRRIEEDEDTEFDDYEDREGFFTSTWNKLISSLRNNFVRPFFMGASGAFGISCGKFKSNINVILC